MSHTYPITMQQDAAPAGPIDAIVRGAVLTLADCLRPPGVRSATVEADAQGLPILAAPFPAAPCTGRAPDGAQLAVHGRYGSWYVVRYDTTEGYVSGDGIVLNY